MNAMIFQNQAGPRSELVIEVAGGVRLPTLRQGDFKLVGKELYDLSADPGETTDIAARHPQVVARMEARLKEVAAERPPLGELPVLMDPALPWVYGRDENAGAAGWIKDHVQAVRAAQPQIWEAGTTP